jgi:5-methylcytosine-specific restriction endonuclease McrBC regulatory subunit McrC
MDEEERVGAASDQTLWDLVALWFVASLETVLRRGLLSDYHEFEDALSVARGRVLALPTARHYYSGRMEFGCEYDEFDEDTPLNRILAAAANAVLGTPFLKMSLRSRARRALARLSGVGRLTPADFRAQVDRRHGYYADALALARHVLAATGRSVELGSERAWSFLIRTPEMVEAGVREILRQGLEDFVSVTNRGRTLEGTTHRLKPDLVFDDIAIGDVKYKLVGADWQRADMYQITTFATGYRVEDAILVSFIGDDGRHALPQLKIGPVRLRHLAWDARDANPPEASAASMISEAREALGLLRPSSSSP